MPNLMTHKIFAEDVLDLANHDIKYHVNRKPQAFSVGSSGPDFLYYHSKFPWQDQKVGAKVRNIGSIIHEKNINEWYRLAINSCLSENDPDVKANMISFMIGHLTHWGLDSTVHPFIFYRTNGSTKDSKYWHYRYESTLDSVMVNKYRKTTIKDYNSKEILKTDAEIQEAIYRVYKDATEKTYNLNFEKDYVVQSFKDADQLLNVLYDPSGYKFKIIRAIEIVSGRKWKFTGNIVTNKLADDVDVLNQNHHQWKNPAKPSFTSNESFLDLYYKAIDITVKVLDEFSLVLIGKEVDDLLALINNKSYKTGLSEYKEMLEFKSVY